MSIPPVTIRTPLQVDQLLPPDGGPKRLFWARRLNVEQFNLAIRALLAETGGVEESDGELANKKESEHGESERGRSDKSESGRGRRRVGGSGHGESKVGGDGGPGTGRRSQHGTAEAAGESGDGSRGRARARRLSHALAAHKGSAGKGEATAETGAADADGTTPGARTEEGGRAYKRSLAQIFFGWFFGRRGGSNEG